MSYKNYFVGKSTISGAGLGVFASRNIPAGTLWNLEDAEQANALSISLPVWQSLIGYLEYLSTVGYSNHTLRSIQTFFEIYGYLCDEPDSVFVVGLTGTTFTNFGPTLTQQQQQQQQKPGQHAAGTAPSTVRRTAAAAISRKAWLRPGEPRHRQQLTTLPGRQPALYANSADVYGSKEPWAQEMSPWEKCTLAMTLRDIKAGEEMLEDYERYAPPCRERGDCPNFMKVQAAEADLAGPEWIQGTRVQLQHIYVANTTAPRGGLRVFAAHDFPAGFVWNREKPSSAFNITREQWGMVMKLQQSLKAAGVRKPLVDGLVSALRSHGYYCPLDDRLYMLLSPSTLTRHGHILPGIPVSGNSSSTWQGDGANSSSSVAGGKLHDSSEPEQQQQQQHELHANSLPVYLADPGQAAHLGATESCLWRQTTEPVKKGEEIVQAIDQNRCDWPGLQDG